MNENELATLFFVFLSTLVLCGVGAILLGFTNELHQIEKKYNSYFKENSEE